MIRKLVPLVRKISAVTWLRISALLTAVALAMMVWSLLQPTPLPVMLAMSVGQAIGTLAFGIYGVVVFVDLRRVRRARRESMQRIEPPPASTREGSAE